MLSIKWDPICAACLIKRANGCDEYDGVGIIKVRDPRVPLSTSTSDVVEMPRNGFPMNCHVKNVLCYTHSLYSSVEDVI